MKPREAAMMAEVADTFTAEDEPQLREHVAVPDQGLVGEGIAYHRKRLGLSQVDLAGLIGRSESWVSQVERGVRQVDRMSILQKVADVLGVSPAELRGEDPGPQSRGRTEAVDLIRSALTGHPAIAALTGADSTTADAARELAGMRSQHARAWELVQAGRSSELAPIIAALIPGLETAARTATSAEMKRDILVLLADTYRASADVMARLGEADAAWLAADRAAFTAEALGDPLAVAAAMVRMAQVFLELREPGQARQAAGAAIHPLGSSITGKHKHAGALSLNGACHLVLAITAAREDNRALADDHLEQARAMADALGTHRDDFGIEFGSSVVTLTAVAVAVTLGDAGHALGLAKNLDMTDLSAELQARHFIDLAAAHVMRRQVGEALHDLQQADALAPQETQVRRLAHDVLHDLLLLSGPRPRPELRDLAEQFGLLTQR